MNRSHRHHLAGLYAITDASITDPVITLKGVEQALQGGATIIQYRDKSSDNERRLHTCSAIRKLTTQANALFIVNDDVDLAKTVNADGVHLGMDDASLLVTRQQLGQDSLIGVSCYNNLERAVEAVNLGADYVAFGSFYSSLTKPDTVKADIPLLKRARDKLSIPVVAIGGITVENALPLIEAGADMVAVVNALFDREDIEASARQFSALFKSSE